MEFEWDEAKAAVNLARHGIAFVKAQEVFDDPLRIEFPDERFDYGEPRMVAIGVVENTVVTVVHCWRGNSARLISARPATSRERRAYQEIPYGH